MSLFQFNTISLDDFEIILIEVFKTLFHHDVNDDNYNNIAGTFDVKRSLLNQLIDTCQESISRGLSMNQLQGGYGLDPSHSDIFLKVWSSSSDSHNMRGIIQHSQLEVNRAVPKSTNSSLYLRDSSAQLNLLMGTSEVKRLQDPRALLMLTLASADANTAPEGAAAGDDGERRGEEDAVVRAELTHEQLFSLFRQLEGAQVALDNLNLHR